MEPASTYPLSLSVDYPDRDLNRLTTAFRVIVAIPILVVLGSVAGESWSWQSAGGGRGAAAGAGGLLFFGPLLMIVFRQKYPRWWFDWNLELLRFIDRVAVFMLLMDDRYPSTDERQSVNLEIAYPEVRTELNRWLPLITWLLAIPHYIVLFFLGVAAFFVVVFAWFAVLFTGRYPRGAFEFVEGVIRWHNRVAAYAFLLITDRYPPFSLQP